MTGAYVAMQPLSEEQSGIRRLGSHGNGRPSATTNSGINVDGISFAFRGAPGNHSEVDKSDDMRLALEEVYAEFTGRKANDNDDSTDLKKRIVAHYRDSSGKPDAKIVLTIVRIDPANQSASFVDALDKLETFTEQSKQALVLDAYHHLSTLDDTKVGERDRLSDAIVHLRKRGAFDYFHLPKDDQQWLGDLVNQKPHLREAIAGAELRYGTQRKALERRDVHEAFQKGSEAIASSAKANIGNLPSQGSVKKLGTGRQVDLPDNTTASEPAHSPTERRIEPLSLKRLALVDARDALLRGIGNGGFTI